MTDPNEQKARQKLEEGEKKLKKTGGFLSFLTGGGGGVTDAAECFVNAANSFKAAKNWSSAGDTFLRVAKLHEDQGDSKFDAAQNYGESGMCYRKVDLQKAVDCYRKATEIFVDMGRFNMAAKAHTTIAEIYEAALGGGEATKTTVLSPEVCKDKAMVEYQKAADHYKGEEQRSSAAKCLLKVAALAAEVEQYQRAMHTFEEVAIYETENQMLKYSAKTHFFQALLCALCYDIIEAQKALKRYEELHPPFTESRECKFVKELMHAVEISDPDGFTEAVQQYDKISRLDNWHVQMLVKVKRHCGDGGEVKNEPGAEEDEDDLR